MSRYTYTYRDYDIAFKYIRACFGHFKRDSISKIRSFVEMAYNRNNLSFNEYLACLDILDDADGGL